jgi:hypothetical protein
MSLTLADLDHEETHHVHAGEAPGYCTRCDDEWPCLGMIVIEYARERAAREACQATAPHPGCLSSAYLTPGAEPLTGSWEEGPAKATFYDWTGHSQTDAYGPTSTAAFVALEAVLRREPIR